MESDTKEIVNSSTAAGKIAPAGTLRNEDFRQLLARKPTQTLSGVPSGLNTQATHSFSHRQAMESKRNLVNTKAKRQRERNMDNDDDDIFGPSNLNEILKNYRDRAEERRKGLGKDDPAEEFHATSAYRAVPGDLRATADAAQRRKQAIQESKYLGGDMEHTHLVKGLDYSLLHKVRSEIALREQKTEDPYDTMYSMDGTMEEPRSENRMVKNIHRILFKKDQVSRNELFRKGRMAYVVDLDEEDNDLPTTRLRSVHDCPANENSQDINTNNLLIQKLSQVLSYLRTDVQKKKKKLEALGNDITKLANQAIYNERELKLHNPNEKDRNRDKDRRHLKPISYFDNGTQSNDREKARDRERVREFDRKEKDRERERRGRDDEKSDLMEKKMEDTVKTVEIPLIEKKKLMADTDSYVECYPGGIYEAAGESDDEADYSKMDMGNRRGPVKRWDFEDHAEYEKYMESKEAMPKAAYQFGVKTNDGRKTRKSMPDREKHKLDREFSQITRILEKRKSDGHGRHDAAKRLKY